ncbi:PREDICTED: GDSL esterase/lipase At1g28600-like isoform X1 [Ipomoea nil]|uniref:GDSL esterase/lipase At1g28600-like isoform X1 n=1 Tax=Ipomoea nil TaxID=35883 RepID=UPI00090122D0|nr:PREDICTED: GDSL esterase/lipase At1g28600-like isoform X1 [Ipomoea nil]
MSLPIVACVLLLTVLASSQFVNGCYTSIFAFGDSIIDTGNYISLISKGLLQYDEIPNCSTPPYGETFFHHPTGRCSDGRLIIDFIAEHYGLPLLPPYSGGGNANPGGGVNFAVIGAPALTDDVLQADWSYSRDNISMMSQINMFKSLLPSICKTSSCDEIFDKSLIIFGSFGSNDYAPTMLSKRVEDAYRLQPLIVNAIGSAIEELIKLGVVNIMVPGMLPVGCLAGCLAVYYGSNEEDYDLSTGCLTWLNEFGQKHNRLLQKELTRIQEHYPNVFITYADYYNARLELFLSPEKYGFNNETGVIACCGSGGPYNAEGDTKCGYPSSHACNDPSSYIEWDGAHLTQAANRWIARGLLSGLYTSPNITASCSTSTSAMWI